MNRPLRATTPTPVRTLLLLLPLLLPSLCPAQYSTPGDGGFALERWEEDYSHLRDTPDDGDRGLFDPIKYVPLNRKGDAYLSFGGQARYRYDYFNNRNFGPGNNDEDGFHLQRYLAHADAHFGPNLRAFVQLNSSFIDDRVGGGRYGDADDVDLQQAFVDVKTSDDANPYVLLRVGRQELVYGAERLVSPDDWRNVRRSFDGVKLSLSVPNDTVEFFWTRPVLVEQDQFNNGDESTSFAGVYNVLALPDLIPKANAKFETYLLALNETEQSVRGVDADTYTAGARFSARPGYWDVDVEGNYQFGNVAGARLTAWSIAVEVGYTVAPAALTPRVSVGLDAASGSPEADGRFNQLFPPTYTYLGHLYLFGRPNLVDVHAGVDFHLTRNVTLFTTHHVYWRQNDDDGIYDLTGAVVRADTGSDAAYVGNEFDAVINWQINRHLSAYLGYAHFFAGDFIAETGPSKDVGFLYTAVTFTF